MDVGVDASPSLEDIDSTTHALRQLSGITTSGEAMMVRVTWAIVIHWVLQGQRVRNFAYTMCWLSRIHKA